MIAPRGWLSRNIGRFRETLHRSPIPPAPQARGWGRQAGLVRRYERDERLLALSAATLRELEGEAVDPIAEEVLGYLEHRGIEDPAARYAERVRRLDALQRRFEVEGRYAAHCYEEVEDVEPEGYALGLLMSLVVTAHRFEILQSLIGFLESPCQGPPRLASVGFGTGYELRWARERLPGWDIIGYETSPWAIEYAEDLLDWFRSPDVELRLEALPLESKEVPAAESGRWGKLVLCEMLEHLERPDRALASVGRLLAPGGHAFVTAAINIAQEDHIWLYRTPEEVREQVRQAGLVIVRERLAPMTVLPFEDEQRARIFRKGNWIGVVEPG